jgi:GABA(A) receptor-associated protein
MKYTSFRELKPLTDRLNEATRILQKYPHRIPVILEKHDDKSPDLNQYKYLIPNDMTLAALIYHVRGRTKLRPEEAIFVYINGNSYNGNTLLTEIYEKEKNQDRFLYVTYSTENTFGGGATAPTRRV